MGLEFAKGGESHRYRAFRGLLKHRSTSERKKDKLVGKSHPAKSKSFWKNWSKKDAGDNPSTEAGLKVIYGVELSLATALVFCFAMTILLMIIREIGLTTRHCVKWDFWTLVATGKRNSVVKLGRHLSRKVWQAR
ncbi:LANO_0H07030g1_1 [Lachancea nothofagi CBS 11611]|uniref:LANO_0H07030g1_1 n=1 Tax=Lachancea nothofagi CBS 11611 TaxID=1266666 RepID=A0A1G4KLV7_9SACH|nr:LANO_0H07030g1_1 [Lachancea nothofagi CBS 11611]